MKKELYYNKRIFLSIFIVLISCLLLFNGSVGAYELTARSLGMGAAYSAIADDIEAILYNPASIANAGVLGLNVNTGMSIHNTEYLEELRKLYKSNKFEELKDFAGGLKDKAGARGQFFLGARVSSIGLAYNVKEDLFINPALNDNFTEKQNQYILNYGKHLLKPPFEIAALYYGINLKYINIERNMYDFSQNLHGTARGNTFSLDLGALAKVTDNLRIACVMENALAHAPELEGELRRYEYVNNEWSWQTLGQAYNYKKELDSKVRLGAAVSIPLLNLTLAADLDNFLAAKEKQVLHLGLEKNLFLNALSLRLGKVQGEELDLNTFGLGLNLTALNLDLAVAKNKVGNNELTGLISASIDF